MRTQRLYHRLREIEEEYRAGLVLEFQKIVAGGLSRYLSRKIPHLFDGRFWRSTESAQLERLEREIQQLRSKLKEPSPGPLVNIVHGFVRDCRETKDKHPGGEVRMAKRCLSELETKCSLPLCQ